MGVMNGRTTPRNSVKSHAPVSATVKIRLILSLVTLFVCLQLRKSSQLLLYDSFRIDRIGSSAVSAIDKLGAELWAPSSGLSCLLSESFTLDDMHCIKSVLQNNSKSADFVFSPDHYPWLNSLKAKSRLVRLHPIKSVKQILSGSDGPAKHFSLNHIAVFLPCSESEPSVHAGQLLALIPNYAKKISILSECPLNLRAAGVLTDSSDLVQLLKGATRADVSTVRVHGDAHPKSHRIMMEADLLVCYPSLTCLIPSLMTYNAASLIASPELYPWVTKTTPRRSTTTAFQVIDPVSLQSTYCQQSMGRTGKWQFKDSSSAFKPYVDKKWARLAKQSDGDTRYNRFVWEDDLCPVTKISRDGFCNVMKALGLKRIFALGDTLQYMALVSLLNLLGMEDLKLHHHLETNDQHSKDTLICRNVPGFRIEIVFYRSNNMWPIFANSTPETSTLPIQIRRKVEAQMRIEEDQQLRKESKPIDYFICARTTGEIFPDQSGHCPWAYAYFNKPSPTLLWTGAGAHANSARHWIEGMDHFERFLRQRRRPQDLIVIRTQHPAHEQCSSAPHPYASIEDYLSGSFDDLRHRDKVLTLNQITTERVTRLQKDGFNVDAHDIYWMTALRRDGHASSKDCLHYNLPGPPDWWSHTLYTKLADLAAQQYRFSSLYSPSSLGMHQVASPPLKAVAKKRKVVFSLPPEGRFKPMVEDTEGLPNVLCGCDNATGFTTSEMNDEPMIDEIQLHIIAWRRADSLSALLSQLESSNYNSWNKPVPLYIHIDGGHDPDTHQIAKGADWTHGPLHIDARSENIGLRRMWIESIGNAARHAGDNTLIIVFEDDTRVSLEYFQWILEVLNAYARNPDCRDSTLVGFSLSPIRVQEMSKPFMRWDARDALGLRFNNEHRHLAYLTNVPSSWGSAFFSDRWQEFDNFVRVRMLPPFYNRSAEAVEVEDYGEFKMSPPELHIPGARSNVWPKSWKRFMVDFMYARGLVMLYPCLAGEEGFATALQESGEHVSKRKRFSPQNPRVADLVQSFDLSSMGYLPRYGDLAVFGLFLKPATRESIAIEGEVFLRSVWDRCPDCREKLIPAWARRGMSVPDNFDASDPIPHICAADMYTSVSASRRRPNSSISSERYLLFEPQYGTNNQLLAVIQAYFWARLLQRRLVLPPIFVPRVSDYMTNITRHKKNQWSDMSKYFHISDFDTNNPQRLPGVILDTPALEPISFAEFAKRKLTPWRMIRVTRGAVFDASAHILTKTFLGLQDIPLINMRSRMPVRNIETIRHFFGGCDDPVLTFDGMFFARLSEINPINIMPDIITLTFASETVFNAVKQNFMDEILNQNSITTDYACYHVRLGDFAEMCDVVENADEKIAIKAFSDKWLREVQEFSCSVSKDQLKSEILKNGLPAFVMTDNPKELTGTLRDLPVPVIASDWIDQAVRKYAAPGTSDWDMQLLSLIIDQHLCAESKYAVLNRFSTVSQHVVSLRRGEDMEFWKKQEP